MLLSIRGSIGECSKLPCASNITDYMIWLLDVTGIWGCPVSCVKLISSSLHMAEDQILCCFHLRQIIIKFVLYDVHPICKTIVPPTLPTASIITWVMLWQIRWMLCCYITWHAHWFTQVILMLHCSYSKNRYARMCR